MSANFTPIQVPHSHKRRALVIGLGIASVVIVFVAGILSFAKPQTSLTRADFVDYKCQEGQYMSDAKSCLDQGGAVVNSIGVGEDSRDMTNVFVCCSKEGMKNPEEPDKDPNQTPRACESGEIVITSVEVICDECTPLP